MRNSIQKFSRCLDARKNRCTALINFTRSLSLFLFLPLSLVIISMEKLKSADFSDVLSGTPATIGPLR